MHKWIKNQEGKGKENVGKNTIKTEMKLKTGKRANKVPENEWKTRKRI